MKTPPFDYVAPPSVEEILALLTEYGDDACVLAGGQSLMPLLALRVVRPAVVIDIGRASSLDEWRMDRGAVCIGATVRQHTLLDNHDLMAAAPLFAEAAQWIGHPATRSRGTIVGSLCHADPAAELPVSALVLDAELVVRSATGERRVAAVDFFESALSTSLGDGELVTELRWPIPSGCTGYGFSELARRHGDFALVAAACAVSLDDRGLLATAKIGLGGVGETPLCFDLVALGGAGAIDDAAIPELAHRVAARLEPATDLHATADYRRSISPVLVERAVRQAVARAGKAS